MASGREKNQSKSLNRVLLVMRVCSKMIFGFICTYATPDLTRLRPVTHSQLFPVSQVSNNIEHKERASLNAAMKIYMIF